MINELKYILCLLSSTPTPIKVGESGGPPQRNFEFLYGSTSILMHFGCNQINFICRISWIENGQFNENESFIAFYLGAVIG